MAVSLSITPFLTERSISSLSSDFLPSISLRNLSAFDGNLHTERKFEHLCLSISCAAPKIKLPRDRSLDRSITKQNKVRFVQKLRTLLLSKPKHFMPIHILGKCRSYLTLSKPRSLLSMIHRYPTIFELFTIPYPPNPMNATKAFDQLCVRLTPAAESLAAYEAHLKKKASGDLAVKLQKLLMLSTHRRLLLPKLVHLAPDLGFPPNFRSRLCNEHPDKFKIVDTSYGRALELVSWNSDLANSFPRMKRQTRDLIVDRPLKFKHLNLRKGLNLKRFHNDYLIKFEEMPEVCPYKTMADKFPKVSMESEKRACAVVREVLAMAVEKRTLVDHLTHFRSDFGLPNRLRGMLVRHPELFYVSLKGERHSVFLVEAYDDNGELVERDGGLVIKEWLIALVREGKRIRRERRKMKDVGGIDIDRFVKAFAVSDDDEEEDEDEDDGFDQMFDWDDVDSEGEEEVLDSSLDVWRKRGLWASEVGDGEPVEPW